MIIPVWHDALFINEMPIWPKFATEICERHGVLQQEINWLIAKQFVSTRIDTILLMKSIFSETKERGSQTRNK